MSAYRLTRQETWVLATLLKLPLRQGSALGEWLGFQDIPSAEEITSWIPSAIQTLDNKGYSPEKNGEKSFSVDLIESLMLAAVGQKHIFVTLRTNVEGVSTCFLLAGSGIVQYAYEQDQIILHSAQQFDQVLQILLPDWLHIGPVEAASSPMRMPQSAFLLFKQAALQRDISFVLNATGSETFNQHVLEESFTRDNGWIDIFHALGINGVARLADISVSAQLEYLLSTGYLEKYDSSTYLIGSAGTALAGTLSDPDQVIITIGFTGLQPEKLWTSVFLIGNSRLYRLDFMSETITITQLRSRLEGLEWIRSMV